MEWNEIKKKLTPSAEMEILPNFVVVNDSIQFSIIEVETNGLL